MTGKSKTVIAILMLVAAVLGGFVYKIHRQNQAVEIKALLYPTPKLLPDFEMTSHTNESFSQNQWLGKWSVVFFGFTFCPDICPTTLSALAEVYDNLPPDVKSKTQFVMVSVDPERDTVERLAGYVPFFNEDFIGIRGSAEQLKTLSMSVGAVYMKQPMGDTYTMQHTGRIFIVDPMGRRFGIFAEDHTNPAIVDVAQVTSDLIQIVRTN
jgi:protein SCO1/2